MNDRIPDSTGEGYIAVNPAGDLVSVRVRTLKADWRWATDGDIKRVASAVSELPPLPLDEDPPAPPASDPPPLAKDPAPLAE